METEDLCLKTTRPTKLLSTRSSPLLKADGNVHHHLPEDRGKIVSGSHHSTSCSAIHGPVSPRAQHEDSCGSSPIGHDPVCRDDRKPHLQAHSLGSDKLTKDCPTVGEAHVSWMSCGVDGGRRINCPEQQLVVPREMHVDQSRVTLVITAGGEGRRM